MAGLQHACVANNLQELCDAIQLASHSSYSIGPKSLRNVCMSLLDPIQALLEANGDSTLY